MGRSESLQKWSEISSAEELTSARTAYRQIFEANVQEEGANLYAKPLATGYIGLYSKIPTEGNRRCPRTDIRLRLSIPNHSPTLGS